MNKYSRFISLINLQWNYTKKLFLVVLSLLGVSEGYFLCSNLSKATFLRKVYDYNANTLIETKDVWSLRFEEYLARSHWNYLFIASILVTLLILISVSFRQKSVAMTEYTYIRLPISTFTWFIATLFYALCMFVILIGVQFLFIILGYRMYLYFVPEEAVMKQSLFLAFVRWDFLRFTFPITDPLRIIYNVFYTYLLQQLILICVLPFVRKV